MDNSNEEEWTSRRKQFRKRQWLKHRQRQKISRQSSPVSPVSTDSLALGSNSSLVESVLPPSQFHKRQWLKNSQRQNISRLLLPLTESSVSTDFLALGSNTSLVEPVLPISQKGRVTDSLGLGRNASLVESVLPDSHVAPDSELKQRRKQFHQWEWLNLFKRV